MTQREYILAVTTLKQRLDAAGIRNSIEIRPVGTFGTVLTMNSSVEASGFVLQVGLENFDFFPDGTVHRAFRYRIFEPGKQPGRDEPLIRLQSAKKFDKYPNHAHFAPNFMADHFNESHWPDWLKNPDFTKAYELLKQIVTGEGALPEPFRSA